MSEDFKKIWRLYNEIHTVKSYRAGKCNEEAYNKLYQIAKEFLQITQKHPEMFDATSAGTAEVALTQFMIRLNKNDVAP